jgi:hypothetical protein
LRLKALSPWREGLGEGVLSLNPAVGGTLIRHGVVPAKAGTQYSQLLYH